MKLLFYILLGLAPIVRPPAARAASNHEVHRLEPETCSGREEIPGLRVSCQSLLPRTVTHGIPVYTLTFVNEQPVRRVLDVVVDHTGALRRQIVLEPSATVSADFALPDSQFCNYYDRAIANVREGGTDKTCDYRISLASFDSRFASSNDNLVNVLIASAVDGIATTADYSHEDEKTKKTHGVYFNFHTQTMGEAGWSADTRAYLAYDLVLLSAAEWAALPSGVRRALVGFAAQGGALILCGQAALPEEAQGFALSTVDSQGTMQEHVVGVGRICFAPPVGADRRPSVSRKGLEVLGIGACQRLSQTLGEKDAVWNVLNNLPALDIPTIPISLFIILLAAFALVLVPVVLVRCIRRQQRIKALIILPLVSAGIGAVIVCCLLFIYGVTPQLTSRAVVLLNAADRRACVRTQSVVFSPTAAADRLRFGRSVQVVKIDWDKKSRSWRDSDNTTMMLTYGNELTAQGKDCLPPLRPTAYVTNEMRDTNARLIVEEIAKGKLKVTNLLGAPLTALCVVDAQGRTYETANLAEGATCELAANDQPGRSLGTPVRKDEPDVCDTRSFFRAEMASCPFGTDLLGGTKAKRNLQTIVYGHYGKEGTK